MLLSKNQAFTLAEVLITLAIIGVIAAISVPSLIQKTNMAEFKTMYKKSYAEGSQIIAKMDIDAAFVPNASWFGAHNFTNFNTFANYIKVVKKCDGATVKTDNCWDMSGEISWQGMGDYPTNSSPAIIDNAGRAWSKLQAYNNTTWSSPEILLDTNGFKKPNQYGKDRFIFQIHPTNFSFDIMMDCTGVIPSDAPYFTVNEQRWRCPSYATSPCLYTSWIAGKD